MITIASYIIIFLTQALSLTFIPISLVGEILKKLKIPLQIGIFIGGLLTWFFINLIWLKVNNHNIPLLLFALFQAKFAIITPALITGAFAERIRFWAYLLFMVLFILKNYKA